MVLLDANRLPCFAALGFRQPDKEQLVPVVSASGCRDHALLVRH